MRLSCQVIAPGSPIPVQVGQDTYSVYFCPLFGLRILGARNEKDTKTQFRDSGLPLTVGVWQNRARRWVR